MALSTKKGITVSLGDTFGERDARRDSLRRLAGLCGFAGRKGQGNISGLLVAISTLGEEDQQALAAVIKRVLMAKGISNC